MKRPVIVGSVVALAAALLLALSGCDEYAYTPSAQDLTRLATEMPDGPMKETAQAIALERYATQSAAEVRAAQAAANATAQAAIYQATADAAQAALEQQRMIATQQAAQATAQAQATVNAFSMQLTAQAAAIEATATEWAFQATATADALNRQATATADALNRQATATAQAKADMLTATHVAWAGQRTATAEAREATRTAYQATATRAAEQREIVLGYGRDYGIPIVLLLISAACCVLIVYGLRQYSRRPIVYPRSILGDAEPMAVPVKGGGYTFVDIDRGPGPVLIARPDGTVQAPLLRSPQQEERTTARDQWLDGQTRPRFGPGHRAGRQGPPLPLAPPPEPGVPGLQRTFRVRRVDLLGPGKAGLLPEGMIRAIEAAWEETHDDDEPLSQ